jgi:glycosyltransferase involved in cell wall biosynthesis
MVPVAFLISRVVREGPITNLLGLLRNLPASVVRPEIVVLDDGSDSRLLEEVADLCVPVTRLAASRSLWRLAANLRSLVSERQYQAVVSCGMRADFLNAISGAQSRRITVKQEPAFTPWRQSRAGTLAVRSAHLAIIARMQCIVCVSEHVRDTLPAQLASRSRVIRNAVDVTRLRPPTPGERMVARDELGISSTSFVVGFVGSMDARKRPDVIADAVVQLRRAGEDVVMLAAGEGPMRRRLQQYRDEAGIVAPGFCDDVRRVLWASDCFALLSTHEGLPLAAIEAMSVGLPLVLSDIAPHRELISGTGVGELVPLGDVQGVAAAIQSLLRAEPNTVPRDVAVARFGAAQMAQDYVRLLCGEAYGS